MKEENEGPGLWVAAIKEELRELREEEIWVMIESAGEVAVVVENLEKGEGVGSVENVGWFVHTDEHFKRDDSGYGSMSDDKGSGDRDSEMVNGYGMSSSEVWPTGNKRRYGDVTKGFSEEEQEKEYMGRCEQTFLSMLQIPRGAKKARLYV